VGFVQDMLDHHDQILRLADSVLATGESPTVRQIAYRVVAAQRREVGMLEQYLAERDLRRGDPERTAMAWMGEPAPVDEMPGMLPEPEVLAALNARGAEADRRFLEALVVHHEGGVHMAEVAAATTDDPVLRRMAGAMAVHQQEELGDVQAMLGR
jgi:uncharacterized protein (DUF305 family)